MFKADKEIAQQQNTIYYNSKTEWTYEGKYTASAVNYTRK